MNNLLKVLPLGTGAIASILAFSNPTQEVYAEYLAWYIRDDFCQETQLETFEKAGCYTITLLPPSTIKPVIINYTRQRNYFLFSIYQTDIGGMKNQVIALGGQFFQF